MDAAMFIKLHIYLNVDMELIPSSAVEKKLVARFSGAGPFAQHPLEQLIRSYGKKDH